MLLGGSVPLRILTPQRYNFSLKAQRFLQKFIIFAKTKYLNHEKIHINHYIYSVFNIMHR